MARVKKDKNTKNTDEVQKIMNFLSRSQKISSPKVFFFCGENKM